MGNGVITNENAAVVPSRAADSMAVLRTRLVYFCAGFAIMFALWWLAITLAGLSPKGAHWAAFGPGPALMALARM